MSQNLSELSARKGLENNLFYKMGKLTTPNGSPSNLELEQLADEFLIGTANTFGTTSFYDFMKPENKGKTVYVCNGSTCKVAGTQVGLKKEIGKHVSDDEIGEMCCLGRCHENSAFNYDGKNYSDKSSDEIEKILNGEKQKPDKYKTKSFGTNILMQEFTSVEQYYAPFTKAIFNDSSEVLEEIKKANIRGRGGAGFPMGFKLESCKNTESDTKFIICNADEGDPGAYSDRYLLEERPHSVLFGMMMAGFASRASHGVLYIRAEYPESVEIIENAISELRENGLVGKNIKNSGFDFNFKVIKAQGAYICGEETALINSIEGQRPEVRTRPPYPTQEGLFNKPTVVNNVETLASLHFIISNGGDKYSSLGTEKSNGTKLVSLDGGFNNPGVYEVEMGVSLDFVVNEIGGGYKQEMRALHIGGPLGGLVPMSKIKDLSIDFESFSNNGFLLGHASIVTLPQSYPLIEYLEHLFEFAADESCGKCFPCRLGTKRGQEMIEKAQNENYKIDKNLFDDLLHTLETGSLCAHGGGMPLAIRNAMEYFPDEINRYFK
jgi:NADH-quinone oxidoreductase subunit F